MGAENSISREEHEEFKKRIEDENHRQNRRLDLLEKNIQEIGNIAMSVEKMAVSLQSMVKEQEQQGKRLEALESRDGEMWRKIISYTITAATGLIIGYIFKQFGM